jgi:hypothetical protein
MAIHLAPQVQRVLGRLIGPLAFAALVLLGGAAVSSSAQAAPRCGDRNAILKTLEQRHEPCERLVRMTSAARPSPVAMVGVP